MKEIVVIIGFCIASLFTSAQQAELTQQKKVNEAVTKLFDGIAELDFTKIQHNATADLIILESGAIWNIDSLATHLEPLKKVSFKRINELDFIKTEVTGNTAWVIYNNVAKMTINGQQRNINWLESAVLVKEGEDWKVKLLHSTTVKAKT